MALWATRPEMQKEIFNYFSSIDCMSLRIMEDRRKVEKSYSSWEKMSAEEQEARIDEWMIPLETQKSYAGNGTDVNVFPTYKIDTGQKVEEMHVLTEQNEITTSWRDEHSNPFTVESKSQMDLRLPDRQGVMKPRRKKSNTSLGKGSQNGDIITNGELPDLLGNMNGGFLGGTESVNDDGSGYFDIDFSNNESFKAETYDLDELVAFDQHVTLDEPVTHDDPVTISGFQILGDESNWSKINDTPTFIRKEEKEKKNERKMEKTQGKKHAKNSEKPSEFTFDFTSTTKPIDDYPQPSDSTSENSKEKQKEPSGKLKKKSKKLVDTNPELPGASTHKPTKPKKGHRKKSSSGNSTTSNQINPRLSLTLDGAIKNLEVAVEQNRQQRQSPAVPKPSDEEESFVDVNRELDYDTLFQDKHSQEDSPLLSSADLKGAGSSGDVQKTGFDFLDNW